MVDIADDVGVFDPRAEVSGALSVDGNHSLEQLAKVVLCRCVSDPETETCVIPGLDVGGAKRGPTDFSLIGGRLFASVLDRGRAPGAGHDRQEADQADAGSQMGR